MLPQGGPMSIRRLAVLVAATVAVTLGGVTAQPSAATAATPRAPRTLHYNAAGAAEFSTVVAQAAQIWNGSVQNVRLVAGSPVDITVVAYDGWPYAEPGSLGRGTIHMGRQAVREGHDPTRIA